MIFSKGLDTPLATYVATSLATDKMPKISDLPTGCLR